MRIVLECMIHLRVVRYAVTCAVFIAATRGYTCVLFHSVESFSQDSLALQRPPSAANNEANQRHRIAEQNIRHSS